MRRSQRLWALTVVAAACLILLGASGASAAQGNEARRQVAFYAHFAAVFGGAAGPATTQYVIFNPNTTGMTVNVRCFNDASQRVGPALGVNVELNAFQQAFHTPPSLLLTTDALYTGSGWCLFNRTTGAADFSVAIIFGLNGTDPGPSGTSNLLTSLASLFVGGDTGQGYISNDDGSVPLWSSQSGWRFFLLLLNPTAANRTLSLTLYNSAGTVQGPALSRALSARDLDTLLLPAAFNLTTPPDIGSVDIDNPGGGFGYCGWMVAFNPGNNQAIVYALALDEDDTDTVFNQVTVP